MTPVTADTKALVLEKVKELPPLPLVVHELLAVMRNPNCSADDITRVLSSDQALASRILRLVNSSFYGVPGGVGTISRAVIILGHASLRSLATGLSVIGAGGSAVPRERRRAFWQHALAVAAGAEILSREIGLPEPEESFVAGLLHDIGHLVLMVALPDRYCTAIDGDSLGDIERERLEIGLDHCRAGRYLLQHWKLPKHLLDIVRFHHLADACEKGDQLQLTAVALADRLARIRGATGETPAIGDDALRLMVVLGITPARVVELLPEIEQRFSAAQAFLQATDQETEDVSAAHFERRRVVIISNDNDRSTWLSGLVAGHGHEPVPARDFLAAIATTPIDIVILDDPSLTATQRQRLDTMLTPVSGKIRIVGAPTAAAADTRASAIRLPLVFAAGDLVV